MLVFIQRKFECVSLTALVNVIRYWRFAGILLLALIGGSRSAQAQMYQMNSSNAFQRFDFSTATVTGLTSMTPTSGGYATTMAAVGNYLYAAAAPSTATNATMRRYTISTDTWVSLPAASNVTQNTVLFTDGTSLYQKAGASQANPGPVAKYDDVAGTWTTITAIGNAYACFSGVGVIYFLTTYGPGGSIKSYNASTGTITTIGPIAPGTQSNFPMCADANNIYMVGSSSGSNNFTKISIPTGSTVALGVAPNNMTNGLVSDGTNVYGKSSGTIYKYVTASSSWTAVNTNTLGGSSPNSALAGSYYVPAVVACAAPVISASVTQATCSGTAVSSNGTLTLTAFDANAKKIDYSPGSTYTGAGYASATSISGSAPYTITSSLPNPAVNQPYTIRVFCDANTYTDKTVLLLPTQCQVADLSVSVSPATQTGNSGEFLTYTVTLTNAGPTTATNVGVSVPLPDPTATFLSATAASGSYSSLTQKWTVPSLPIGSTTLTFTVKVN